MGAYQRDLFSFAKKILKILPPHPPESQYQIHMFQGICSIYISACSFTGNGHQLNTNHMYLATD